MKSGVHHIDVANRILAWREFGTPDGTPVFYFHSYPGSSWEASLLDDAARERGLRIIAVDRPGIGDSSMAPIRSLKDFPGDVAFLAKHLGLSEFSVLAFSEGAAYAWACGALLGKQVRKIAIVSGTVPADCAFTATMRAMKALALLPFETRALHNPERVERRWVADLAAQGEQEAAAAGNVTYRRAMLEARREAFFEGSGGPVKDFSLVTGANWGFPLGGVEAPAIVWHGDADLHTPVAQIRQLCLRVPMCDVRVRQNEGHHSLWLSVQHEALDELAQEN